MDGWLARVIDEAQAGQLPFLIEDWRDAPDARRWIALAVRLDLPILIARPELAPACVRRRCAWLGAEGGFYVDRAPIDAAELRACVESWPAAIRSLRPPHVPLDAGAIEEYRTSAQGRLWITRDEVGAGEVAWDRVTCARITREPPAPAKWLVADKQIKLGDTWLDIQLAAGERVAAVHSLDDELAVIAIRTPDPYDEGYDGHAFYLIDASSGRSRWRGDAICDGAALARDGLYVWSRGRVAIFDVASGEVLRGFELPATEVAVADDGTFATRVDHVIRVWDPARAAAPALSSTHWLAQCSPDGRRILTGHLLCDAVTGALIARLPLRGIGGWLEGGPPRRAWTLCNRIVGELMPFGFQAWDAETGAPLVADPKRHARIGDAVAFDSEGDRHAIWNRSGLTAWNVRTGAVLFRRDLAHARENTIGFTPDGTHLWWQRAADVFEIADLATDEVRALDESPIATVPSATITDGMLVAGDAALPIDCAHAIVAGDVIVGWNTHYQARALAWMNE